MQWCGLYQIHSCTQEQTRLKTRSGALELVLPRPIEYLGVKFLYSLPGPIVQWNDISP